MDLCIIPARGGSKRIKKKNIKDFCGKPIIYYPIKAALKSESFQKVIVSTDDKQIAEIAMYYGAEVPFQRPNNISEDRSSTLDVIRHAIDFYKSNFLLDTICCLYPTSPFIKSDDLKKAINISKSNYGSVLLSTVQYGHPIERSFTIEMNGKTKLRFKDFINLRTQDIKNSFHDAGQFYFADRLTWEIVDNLIDNAVPYNFPNWLINDIDNIEDWERAEIIYKLLNEIDK